MFDQYIGRIVAFVLTPILLVAVPPAVNAVNEVLGTGFTDQQIIQYALAAAVGLALVVYKWLQNRGEWEVLIAAGEQAKDIVAEGSTHLPADAGSPVSGTDSAPVVPPGVLREADGDV